ncbi:MAG: tRNA guanosine(34) transglycosylase Tgt [Candidatus Saccharibacteria bacterium]|nr:tRNA guanosine(34) transglycosylase Tgt [Candidatus Saccharibacteria bacterium]
MFKGLEFKIEARLTNGLGRAGVIKTPHGEIKTPAFMVVGTHGVVKFVGADELAGTGAQAMLSNGYHLRRRAAEIAAKGGLAAWSGWQGPTLTDSGGFQVMSLGSGLGKVVSMERKEGVVNTVHKDRLAKVREEGVEFIDPFDGQVEFMGPEESMKIQCQIGADIHMAFDELTSLADDYDYNVEALGRTERWAARSLEEHRRWRDSLGYRQSLYGVVQGGHWEDLRKRAAASLATMDFDGFGLGGAFLKEDLAEILRWCNEELPEEKPRHLLGLSRPDDIMIGAAMGADTFDCVAPTREARHGRIYTLDGDIQLRKFANSEELLDENCDCPTCRTGWTRGGLRALWRSGEMEQKQKYYTLASLHNIRFIVRLTEQVREAIIRGQFEDFKAQFLKRYYHQ